MPETVQRLCLGVVRCLLAILSIATLAASEATSAESEESGDILVELVGVEVSDGELVVALYADAGSFDDGGEPVRSGRLEPGEEVVWEVAEVAFGWYAVKAYHDLDGDGELDRGAFGRPTEPYGFSNDARGRFGPPSFEAARFEHRSATSRIEIELR